MGCYQALRAVRHVASIILGNTTYIYCGKSKPMMDPKKTTYSSSFTQVATFGSDYKEIIWSPFIHIYPRTGVQSWITSNLRDGQPAKRQTGRDGNVGESRGTYSRGMYVVTTEC